MSTTTPLDWSKADLWGPPRPRRSIGAVHAWWAVFWFVAVQVLVAVAVVGAVAADPRLGPDFASSGPVTLAGMLALWAVFIAYPWWVSRRRGTGRLAADYRLALPTLPNLAVGVGLGLALRAVSTGIAALSEALGLPAADNASWLASGYSPAVLVALAVGACLVGPVGEEMFYRGVVLQSLTRWAAVPAPARATVAVLVSSLAFGLSHTTGTDLAAGSVIAQTALIGAVLAALALGRFGLGTACVAHVVFNTSGVLLLLLGAAA